jgi:hypothetical protein
MLPCKEIVRILSSEEDIGVRRKMELKMHLAMCRHCSAYRKHLELMKKGFKGLFSKMTETESGSVKGLESRILNDFKKRQGGS